jgi:hypothetical protein
MNLCLTHSEHGDSRHPAVRVLETSGGAVVGDLWDGPGLGVRPIGFAPTIGDDRLLSCGTTGTADPTSCCGESAPVSTMEPFR